MENKTGCQIVDKWKLCFILLPYSFFNFSVSLLLHFFSKHFALKVRWGKKCRRVEKIGKLETNFKNFALTGRKKAQQTNYRKLIVGMGERRRRGIDGQSDWMTERLTDNWTSVASQGEGGEAKRRRVVLRRRNVKTNVTTGGREREGGREGGGGAFLCCCRRDADARLPAAVICFCCSRCAALLVLVAVVVVSVCSQQIKRR